ncbi:hypothetical protein WDH52_03675 [Streptomyces sp. TRM70308]|uniref:hypothetical protein n=1 Tax=Streptomyces sp. TRM70308 TaxID=3131932 RepID=UPI003CFC30BC
MHLRFVGIDPNTGDGESPTVWVDEDNADLVFQGWKADDETTEGCLKTGGIPDHEAVVRVPARMIHIIREACDAAERAQLR